MIRLPARMITTMIEGARIDLLADRAVSPRVLGVYHLSADGSIRRLGGDLPPRIRFPIGSVTKTLTALLAARLAVDGAISWDRPLALSTNDQVTLGSLLSHTAAVPFELLPSHWSAEPLTEAGLATALAKPPRLPLPPGTWHYSNLGYALAARLLEDATGLEFRMLLDERLLQPLGMTMTSFPDEAVEGPLVLGAAAPAGDMWSTLEDLMTLAQAIDGHSGDVVTRSMLGLLLQTAIPGPDGACFGAGIRTHGFRNYRVLVSTGTIRDRTTCVTVWPSRGASVLVAEAGYSHDTLWEAAAVKWHPGDTQVRSLWWDGQEVVELRHGDEVELTLRETSWPFALFSGRATGRSITGVDWRGKPLELVDRGDALAGNGFRFTADVTGSAFEAAVQS
jgi:CubicO group peptidase (beta-lactamase class C family)